MSRQDLLVVAGEASGDLHGARLLAELRRQVPFELKAFGLGGEELEASGLEPVSREPIAVVGLTEVLKILPRAWKVYRRLLAEVDRRRPTVAVLVDFPEFNLRLARQLQKREVTVVYYVSPQIWAWRRGRVRSIARVVDEMLVLFPFEAKFYQDHGVAVRHVGHPLVAEVPELPQIWDDIENSPGGGSAESFRIALLPGSRPSEVEKLLPIMIESVERLAADAPAGRAVTARLIRAATIPKAQVAEAVERASAEIEIIDQDRFEAVAGCHLALCASGTATLMTGLLTTPMLVLYRLSRWTYLLARALVRLEHISLVNLVLGRGAVPELLQDQARPEVVAREARRLLEDRPAVDAMRGALAELRSALGDAGASRRAAEAVAAHLLAGPLEDTP